MPSIKGTASISSSSAQNKLLRSTKFPPSFSQQVDLSKVNAAVITLWIEKEIEKILGFEDEIVASMAVNLFFPKIKTDDIHAPVTYGAVDPRHAQLDLVGFLGDAEAAKFASELWEMMQDAQDQPKGIPRILIERKKAEIAAQKAAASKEVATAAKSTNPLVAEAARRAEAARKALGRQGQRQQMRHYQDRGRDGRDSRDRDRNREWKPHPRAIAPMGGRNVARPVSPQNSVQHNRDAACKVPSDDHRKRGNSRSRSRSRSRNKHEKQEDVGQSSGEDSYGRRRHRKSKHRRREKDHDNNKDDGGRRSRKHSRRRRRSRSRSRDRTRGSSSRYYRDDRDRRYEDSGNDRKSSSRRSGSNESGSERKSSSRRSGSRRDGNSKRTSKRDYSRSRSRSRSNRHDRSRSQSSCSSKGDSRRSRSS